MGRAPCCSKLGLHRGPWSSKEDSMLSNYITVHGEGHWRSMPNQAGLLRCGKSCRLRWMNYLRPDIKRGNLSPQEDDLIIRLHSLLGNKWSLIARRLPGRTDNEIKNYWNTCLCKKIIPSSLPHKMITTCTTPKIKPKKQSILALANYENIIEFKHTVHRPKPVRLGSFTNMSGLVQTSESNNNNYSDPHTNTECSSFSSSENTLSINNNIFSCSAEEGDQEIDHVRAMYNNNNGSHHAAWGGVMMQLNEAFVDSFHLGNNKRIAWEWLYEEYLQLTNDGCQVDLQPNEE